MTATTNKKGESSTIRPAPPRAYCTSFRKFLSVPRLEMAIIATAFVIGFISGLPK